MDVIKGLTIAAVLFCTVIGIALIDSESVDAEIGDTITVGDYTFSITLETPRTVTLTGTIVANPTSIEIPESIEYDSKTYTVTSIGKDSFKNKTTIASIIIPKTITSISPTAFEGCKNVTSLYFDAESCADFPYTSSLSIGSGGSATITFGPNVTKIPDNIFRESYGIGKIIVGPKVQSIGEYAFLKNQNLKSVDLSNATGLEIIKDGAFKECKVLETLDLSNSTLSEIGESAFSGCYALTSIHLNNTITAIGSYAFESCSHVSYIYYDVPKNNSDSVAIFLNAATNPDELTVVFGTHVKEIPKSLFVYRSGYTSKIKTLDIPDGVVSIGNHAFNRSSNLTSLILPSTLQKIGEGAFENCTKLTTLTIPENVTSIGNGAFKMCNSLSKINYNAIESSVPSSPFYYESSTERSVIFGDKVKVIPASLFCGSRQNITSVTIGKSVETIGDSAFENVYRLKNISFLSCPTIGSNAFALGYKTGYSTFSTTCNVYSMLDRDFLTQHSNNITTFIYTQIPHVECDLKGISIDTIPKTWSLYDGKLYKYYDVGEAISLPTPTSKTKIFEEWSPSPSSTMGSTTLKYEATWTAFHTVTYDTAGGTSCSPAKVKEGSIIPLPTTTRTGYELTGWSIPAGTKMGETDITVTANWEIKTVTVTFMNDGNEVSKVSGKYGSTLTAPSITKQGFFLTGWTDFNGKFPASDTTCIAIWVDENSASLYHTVTFDTVGGTPCPQITVKQGEIIPLPTTTRTGYTFVEWSIPSGTKMGTEDITVIAFWKSTKIVTVYFIGYDDQVFQTRSGSPGDLIPKEPRLPDTSSKIFLNWKNYNGYFPDNNTKYYPNWAINGGSTPSGPSFPSYSTYHIDVKSKTILSDGTWTIYDSGSTVSGGGYYNYGDEATLKAIPAHGYKFVKWSDGSTKSTHKVTVTGNETYTASFQMIDPYETGKEIGEDIGKMIVIGIIGVVIFGALLLIALFRHK